MKRHVTYTSEEYKNALDLLKLHKTCGKVARLTGIPRTTVRNWKLRYALPNNFRKTVRREVNLHEIEILAKEGKKVPKIAAELGLSYNTVLLLVKKHFNEIYESNLKPKFHKLTEKQKEITPELAYILGVMFGDGSVYGKDKVIRLGVKDKDFRDVFASVLESWSKKKPYTTHYLNRGRVHHQCILWSKDAGTFLDSVRKRGRVPPTIINSDNELLKIMFVRGFADSEGGVMNNSIGVFNKNLVVLRDIRKILIELGFDSNHLGIKCDKKGVYCLLITTRQNLKIFEEKIKFSIARKQNKLKATTGIRTQPRGSTGLYATTTSWRP